MATTKTIIPEDYNAWIKNKLILTDASFKEIVEYLEVLGTVFNIRGRLGKTEIVLEQGKVKVSFFEARKWRL